MPLRQIMLILFVSLSLYGCKNSDGNVTEVKNNVVPSSSKSAPKSEGAAEALAEATPDPEAMNDPEYWSVLSRFKKESDAYWNERFTKCADPSTTDDRWFCVVIDGTDKHYLEIRNIQWIPPIPYRTNYAEKLEKEWFGSSTLLTKVQRQCPESGPCGKYTSDSVTPTYSMRMEKGKFEGTPDRITQTFYKLHSCDEVKRLPIWKTP